MPWYHLTRRSVLRLAGLGITGFGGAMVAKRWLQGTGETSPMLTVYTFGDSILDCARYNPFGVHPGQLLVRNDDRLFPAFRGLDLSTHRRTQLVHRARDGATIADLATQVRNLPVARPAIALLTIGGNDLLRGLAADPGSGIEIFGKQLDQFLSKLPIQPILVGTVYDPTFGDDTRNFLGIDPTIARANHRRVNAILADLAARYGTLVDLHAHFLTGDPSWFTRTIEPSLQGASEIRRCFLQPALNLCSRQGEVMPHDTLGAAKPALGAGNAVA